MPTRDEMLKVIYEKLSCKYVVWLWDILWYMLKNKHQIYSQIKSTLTSESSKCRYKLTHSIEWDQSIECIEYIYHLCK